MSLGMSGQKGRFQSKLIDKNSTLKDQAVFDWTDSSIMCIDPQTLKTWSCANEIIPGPEHNAPVIEA